MGVHETGWTKEGGRGSNMEDSMCLFGLQWAGKVTVGREHRRVVIASWAEEKAWYCFPRVGWWMCWQSIMTEKHHRSKLGYRHGGGKFQMRHVVIAAQQGGKYVLQDWGVMGHLNRGRRGQGLYVKATMKFLRWAWGNQCQRSVEWDR